MYLKALEIQGFKSFPDKTVLNFGEDITAIVGPNGSGKSNISDAILWVMGEQSSRSLRGGKMEDVIFGGTEKRGQMGFAQVTLVIDNTEHIFNRDENEVAVTRRYYRSGESEYYINRQTVRLKDISELFMDTGMGREGYSIIGQGKIDEILSVKSGERREIFEEAAGISKFRHRKEEAERKMERTEENLVRINDKIAELELQVGPLREQSEKAKKFLLLRDELRVLEISVWLTNLEALKAAARKLEADYAAAQEELTAANAAVEAQYAAAERFSDAVRENDLRAEELRGGVTGLEERIGEKEAEIAVLKTSHAHNEENILRVEEELRQQEGRAGGLEEKIEAHRRRLAEIDGSAAELQEALEALLCSARAAAEKAAGAGEEADALAAKEALAVGAAADARAERSALEASLREMDERTAAVQGERETAETQLGDAGEKAKQTRRALEDAEEEAAAVRNVIEGHTLKMQQRRARSEQAEQKKLQTTMELGAMDSRIRLLTDMEKEYEGFNKAVRTAMQAAERGALRGVRGTVAGLMETERQYAVAVEIALGPALQNIVVEREEDAKSAIALLKQRDAGRATFLPLSAIRGDELRESGLEGERGYVGLASSLIRFDEPYRDVFLFLLGRTAVCEDLDAGIAMSRKYQRRFRIVTLDGQVINRGGSMTGGSVNERSGILSRAGELRELTGKRQTLADALAAAETEAAEAKRELTKAEYELSTAEGQRRSAEDAVLKLQGEKNHYELLLSAMRENLTALAGEAETLSARAAGARERMSGAEERIRAQDALAAEHRAAAESRRSGQNELLGEGADLASRVAEKKAEAAALAAERSATDGALGNLTALRSDMAGDRSSREALAESYRVKNRELEEKAAALSDEAAALRAEAQALRERLAAVGEEKLRLEQERNANDRRSRELNEQLLSVERNASQLEQKRATSALEEKAVLDKLWEHYELSHSAAMELRVELESLPKAGRRIGELKREIGALGNVNVGAIEEFERVNTRYTYLTGQRDDVERSREELSGIIEGITREMTAIFGEQFALLRESFQETFAELFGGGKATLELEDPEDILGCGIEIKAQPPGKALKTISLLSGGEKAFVAIALYFSILKVHPTPFCVMDEIEAALDEPNVIRVAKYMRKIAGRTQFVVITHRRGTMEEADVLYGVTMQERGVSKILTINMNDMAKELHIK